MKTFPDSINAYDSAFQVSTLLALVIESIAQGRVDDSWTLSEQATTGLVFLLMLVQGQIEGLGNRVLELEQEERGKSEDAAPKSSEKDNAEIDGKR